MSKIAIKGATTGTGVFTLESPATNTDRTLILPDEAGTVLTSASNVAQKGVPAFSAYQSSAQTIAQNVVTKVALQSKEFDTSSAFDNTTNYRFQPTTAGYYFINAGIGVDSSPQNFQVLIYKSGLGNKVGTNAASQYWGVASSLLYLNGTTDYVELYTYFGGGSFNLVANINLTYLQGHLVRAD